MSKTLRPSTLQTLGLGTVQEIFRKGRLPADAGTLVERVFGPPGDRGSLVISGANGIVGAGKIMQLGSRLEPHGVRVIGLDLPGAPDGIGRHYPGLRRSFGPERADRIMAGILRLSYDGARLPDELKRLNPRFLLEAIPEILDLKKAHYEVFRKMFPEIRIRSVTSGFPASALGVGIAHPAFPHEINKVWEIVEPEPSSSTQLLWALGLIPVPVGDHWSFVLDVLFCGVTLAATRFHHRSNMPYWKIDKFVRRLLGPNPFRAHDSIGARGANFLTWSCLHHLAERYGEVFKPTRELEERKENGEDWYPPDRFRPLVNWSLDSEEEEEFENWILGSLFQMTSLMLHEKRGHLSHINTIGEACAQFRKGILAVMRDQGAEGVIRRVEAYHRLHPQADGGGWFPEVLEQIGTPAWQQLYVNAEHDGELGVITIGRESYNGDVDAELNRAIDWLRAEGIDRVIVTGDFHLATQMVGADTSEFFPALQEIERGERIAGDWSATARRLNDDFRVSVGFINGKRCLGGFLELLMHCHALVAVEDAVLGMPEVTLPVVPGMEGCHWPFRKAPAEHWPRLVSLLLGGRTVRARDAVDWLIDHAGPMEDALQRARATAAASEGALKLRPIQEAGLEGLPEEVRDLPPPEDPATRSAQRAIMDCIRASCSTPLAEALTVQARHSAGFMATNECRSGRVGAEYQRTMVV